MRQDSKIREWPALPASCSAPSRTFNLKVVRSWWLALPLPAELARGPRPPALCRSREPNGGRAENSMRPRKAFHEPRYGANLRPRLLCFAQMAFFSWNSRILILRLLAVFRGCQAYRFLHGKLAGDWVLGVPG